MPWDDESGKSKGFVESHMQHLISEMTICRFMFVEFKNVDDANLALASIHDHPFDARHTFKVARFTDIERYASMDETYTEPELGEYTPKADLCTPIYCPTEV
jgi:translation initiation factor 3 subunit B